MKLIALPILVVAILLMSWGFVLKYRAEVGKAEVRQIQAQTQYEVQTTRARADADAQVTQANGQYNQAAALAYTMIVSASLPWLIIGAAALVVLVMLLCTTIIVVSGRRQQLGSTRVVYLPRPGERRIDAWREIVNSKNHLLD